MLSLAADRKTPLECEQGSTPVSDPAGKLT